MVKTMGMVLVAALAGIAEMVFATITATGRRTKSRTPAIDHDDLLLSEIPSFGLPELLVAIQTSRQSCSKAGKARIFALVWESSGEIPVQTARPFGPR